MTRIPSDYFKGCSSLTKISIPYGVTEIEDSAFSDCTGLTDIAFPSSIKVLGNSILSNCSNLKQIYISEELYKNNPSAWNGCPDTVKINFLKNNPFKAKGKTAKVKYSKVRKKNKTVSVSKVLKISPKGTGSMLFAKVSGKKKITVNRTTGKVTVKKKLKRGTYKIKVKVMSTGNATYKASAWKSVTFKIKVK